MPLSGLFFDYVLRGEMMDHVMTTEITKGKTQPERKATRMSDGLTKFKRGGGGGGG